MKAVAAIIRQNESILLAKRSEKCSEEPSAWENIGGSVDENETFERAIIREIKEETGCDFQIISIAIEYRDENSKNHVIVYFGNLIGTPKITEPDYCIEQKWVKISELKNYNLAKYTTEDFRRLGWID